MLVSCTPQERFTSVNWVKRESQIGSSVLLVSQVVLGALYIIAYGATVAKIMLKNMCV